MACCQGTMFHVKGQVLFAGRFEGSYSGCGIGGGVLVRHGTSGLEKGVTLCVLREPVLRSRVTQAILLRRAACHTDGAMIGQGLPGEGAVHAW